ncbi:flagellar L-ring protein precursor FlgH [Malonomonas rubra DSM 5091]|uniref:Flagellar L-ring protein n=1 Tax=Malonomonas rubra DSM 5091 TaxID=1122189 RepID=A0A1M6MBJ2_MALRU|nr:flagellar basal body L-ring protein FlgH [Malonomonas rubra]SHJ80643.1 flagellar L-ring protein precursor FlgH [Malonomonas rubra DSM 5091]
MKSIFFALIVLTIQLSGCAGPARNVDLTATEPIEPVLQPPLPPQTAGSLWTESRGGLFQDMKARTVGDIITVVIVENASASKEATTETDRTSTMSAGIPRLLGLEGTIGRLAGADGTDTLISASTSNEFEGTGKTERTETLTATLTTQVIEVLPNGNLRLEGTKTVTVNSETQIVKLTGIVRPADVSAGNIVDSKNVLNARIAYVGEGVISDKQQQGWLVRGLDQIWPF